MALASLFGGISPANAKLGAVHGIAGPLGSMINAPHGQICACLLPYVTESNIKALEKGGDNSGMLSRYEEVSYLLNERDDATLTDLTDYLHKLVDDFKLSPLAKHGLLTEDFPELITKSMRASSMKGNPVILNNTEINEILSNAI